MNEGKKGEREEGTEETKFDSDVIPPPPPKEGEVGEEEVEADVHDLDVIPPPKK